MVKCSVLLPVYNGSAFITKTIQSILDQEYTDYEIVIVDDGSTDDSCALIKGLLGSDHRIIANERNVGVGRTLRKAFKAAKGEFIAMIGQDDVWQKGYLKSQIEYLKHNDCIASFANVKYIDAQDSRISFQLFKHELLDKFECADLFLELLKGNFLCAPASVFRVEKGKKLEYGNFWGYNNDRLQDYELWLNLVTRGRFRHNRDATCNYRLHSANFSSVEKGVSQESFEFYSTIRNVLFSEGFLNYISGMKDIDGFISSLLGILECDIAHAKILEILIIDFCEYLLDKGIGSESLLLKAMADRYNSLGILTKAKRAMGYLPRRIKVSALYCKNGVILKGFESNPNFEIIKSADGDRKKLFLIDEGNHELAMNDADVLGSLPYNRVIMICGSDQVVPWAKKHPNILVLRADADVSREENRIISFVEDKTDLFANSLITRHADDAIDLKMTFLNHLILNNERESIRSLMFLGIPGQKPRKIKIFDDQWKSLNVQFDTASNSHIFGKPGIHSLIIEFDEPIKPDLQIVVNNILYIMHSVIYDKIYFAEFSPISFFYTTF